MNEPRLRREALIAQLAGELDELLERVERLAPTLESANERLELSGAAIKAALEQYRANVATLTEQVMRNIAEFAVRRTKEAAATSAAQQQGLLQVCAREAFEVELAPHLRELTKVVSRAAQDAQRPFWSTWVEHAATALLTAVITAAGVLYLVRG